MVWKCPHYFAGKKYYRRITLGVKAVLLAKSVQKKPSLKWTLLSIKHLTTQRGTKKCAVLY